MRRRIDRRTPNVRMGKGDRKYVLRRMMLAARPAKVMIHGVGIVEI